MSEAIKKAEEFIKDMVEGNEENEECIFHERGVSDEEYLEMRKNLMEIEVDATNVLHCLKQENEQLLQQIKELEGYKESNEDYKEKFYLVSSWVVNKEKEVNKPKITIGKSTFEQIESFIDHADLSVLESHSSVEVLQDPFLKRLIEIEEGRKRSLAVNIKKFSGTLQTRVENDEEYKTFNADDVPVGGLKEDE